MPSFESPPPSIPPETNLAMEGRRIINGVDLGDEAYHRGGWKTTPEAEQHDVNVIVDAEPLLAETQIEGLAAASPQLACIGFQRLLTRFPHHERTAIWQQRITELTK